MVQQLYDCTESSYWTYEVLITERLCGITGGRGSSDMVDQMTHLITLEFSLAFPYSCRTDRLHS